MLTQEFKLKDFDGPLDLLLVLIGKAQIDIRDIFVSEITDQYLDIVRNAPDLNMDESSDFLVMAATEEYPLPPQEYELKGLTLEGLTEAFIRIWSRRPSLDDNPESNHYAPRNIQRDSHTVQECMLELITAMKKKRKMRFSEAFVHAPTREAVVTYFLAVLELLRLGQLHIRQTSVYGEIELIRGRYKPIRETDLTTAAGNGSTE